MASREAGGLGRGRRCAPLALCSPPQRTHRPRSRRPPSPHLYIRVSIKRFYNVLNEKKLQEVDSLWKEFETPEKANKIVKLKHFEKFQDTTEALAASTALVEGKLSKNLKKILKKIVAKDAHEQLAVADAKLGGVIKDKLNLSCIHSPMVTELMRGIRSQIEGLITGLPSREMAAMCLGLAHSLSRYKLKFSPDKVDTMIVQAISLLDDLDKELNNYIMRCREWYGWHFPELGKIITDNLTYCKCVRKVGDRRNFASSDVSDILSEEIEEDVKAAAEISMGTEVSEEDINNIIHLCDQVIEISEYRTQLYDYLKNRMMAIAPNLTVMVGELVGARLIAHAGSLLNLAKHPASTVQILGAEKALFRALKTKRDTPKFGLIYHASLVGQTTAKNKGKISRMLAAKTALTIRYDALGDDTSAEMGAENRLKVETRLRHLEERGIRRISGTGKALARADKYQNKSEVKIYDPSGDSTLPAVPKKRKIQEVEDQEAGVAVKAKKLKTETKEETNVEEGEPVKKKKKKKEKKRQAEAEDEGALNEEAATSPTVENAEKKKKKKKKVKEEDED
ncbi:PREDICTED: nucleolar protein 58 [Tinamus guttatus]|uniref:nucleolar protein 58 n=1 Tax=Tinamus guttatus TaxID=94827 RepID=UPI00052EC8AE|nr:PREDICTED: nucleolar protein 58 [Tinamus guttatus]